MAAVVAGLVSPRTFAATVPTVSLAVFIAAYRQRGLDFSRLMPPGPGRSLALAFMAFGLLSMTWADLPKAVLVTVLSATAYVTACVVATSEILREPKSNVYHVAEGLWLGTLLGLCYLAIEILSDQSIKMFIYTWFDVPKHWLRPAGFFTWDKDTLVAISPIDLTRSIAPISLLLWASLLALRPTAPKGNARLWSWGLFGLAAFVVAISEHETSKLAIVLSGLTFVLARYSTAASDRAIKLVWVFACLAVVPTALALHRLDLHAATPLQDSLRHRIVIWNHTAEQVLKSPVVGIGAGMMYYLDPEGEKPGNESAATDGVVFQGRSPHAHNIYLQTWFELGVVGAALLTLIGLAIIERMRRFNADVLPYAHATFVSAMTMAAGSYGMWQPWFIALYALTAMAFAVAMRANATVDDATVA